MGIFHYLIHGLDTVREWLKNDSKTLFTHYQDHLKNHNERFEILRTINLAKIDSALLNVPSFKKTILFIKDLLEKDLVIVKEQIEEDEVVIRDLNQILISEYSESSTQFPTILPSDHFEELSDLKSKVASCLELQRTFKVLLMKYYHILKLEFRLCKKILATETKSEMRRLTVFLLTLFFKYEKYAMSALPGLINAEQDISAVYFGTKIRDELSMIELTFVENCTNQMGNDTNKLYRPLGEYIVSELLRMSGKWRMSDLASCLRKFEQLSANEVAITKSIKKYFSGEQKKFKTKYTERDFFLFFKAFEMSLKLGHFERIADEFLVSKGLDEALNPEL